MLAKIRGSSLRLTGGTWRIPLVTVVTFAAVRVVTGGKPLPSATFEGQLPARAACVTLVAMSLVRVLSFSAVVLGACAPILGIEDVTAVKEPDASTPSPFDAATPDVSVVDAAVEDVVEEKSTEPQPKRVFVTSDVFNGFMGGESSVDARCIAAADRAGLGGSWVAWISADGKNAIDRIEHDGPYQRLDGLRVVRNKAQLASGVLTNPIDVLETGERFGGEIRVWTGTRANGAAGVDCNNWSTSNALVFGTLGELNRTNAGWTDNGGTGPTRDWGCQTVARLYCFER
jgi:hypothetical protein